MIYVFHFSSLLFTPPRLSLRLRLPYATIFARYFHATRHFLLLLSHCLITYYFATLTPFTPRAFIATLRAFARCHMLRHEFVHFLYFMPLIDMSSTLRCALRRQRLIRSRRLYFICCHADALIFTAMRIRASATSYVMRYVVAADAAIYAATRGHARCRACRGFRATHA